MNQKDLHESNLTVAGSIIVGALIIAWSVISVGGNLTSGTPAKTTPQGAVTNPSAKVIDISKISTSGEPVLGNKNAQITIGYWYDYQCPFCKQGEDKIVAQLVKEYVKTGKAKIVFKDYAFLGTDSTRLALASRAVYEVAPAKFYEWHKEMFASQGQENSGWATDAYIKTVTERVLGEATADKVIALMTSKAVEYKAEIDADKAEGSGYGITGTPAFVIGSGNKGELAIGARPYADIKAIVSSYER